MLRLIAAECDRCDAAIANRYSRQRWLSTLQSTGTNEYNCTEWMYSLGE